MCGSAGGVRQRPPEDARNYRCVSGEHENWDDYHSAMQRERRVLLRITLNRAGPDRAG